MFPNYLFVHLFSVAIFALINLKFKFCTVYGKRCFHLLGTRFNISQCVNNCYLMLLPFLPYFPSVYFGKIYDTLCAVFMLKCWSSYLVFGMCAWCVCVCIGKCVFWLLGGHTSTIKMSYPTIGCMYCPTEQKTLLDTERFVTFGDKHNNTYPFVTFKNIWNKRMGPMCCDWTIAAKT